MRTAAALGTVAVLTLTGAAAAQTAHAPPPTLVINRADVPSGKSLAITSDDFGPGGAIPFDDTGYGASKSPPFTISGAPRGVKTFAMVMEDPDSQFKGEAILHWFAYNLPGGTTHVPGALPEGARITTPVVLSQGLSIRGRPAYFGPRPPPRPPFTHHYHLEVFALDAALPDGLADRAALVTAMSGHVLASGELVGVSTAPAPKPAS